MDIVSALGVLKQGIKSCARYYYVLIPITGFCLFAGSNILEALGIADLVNNYRSVFGMTLIVSGAFFGCFIITAGWRFIENIRERRRIFRYIKKTLISMPEEEKEILRFYAIGKVRANLLHVDDCFVQSLTMKGFISRAPVAHSWSNSFPIFPFIIDDTAWHYFEELGVELLKGVSDRWRTDEGKDVHQAVRQALHEACPELFNRG